MESATSHGMKLVEAALWTVKQLAVRYCCYFIYFCLFINV